MIASRTRGGGRITVDQRADGSGDALQAIIGDVGDLSVQAAVGDFDLATLLAQVPAPLTALNLEACRMRFHRQLAASLLELEATAIGVKVAAFAYRQAEKGISEAFGGLLDAIGYATGRIIAISLPVIVPVAITIGVQVLVVSKILDVTGLDDVITQHFGIDLGKTKAQIKEALVTAVFEHSDVAGAVIEHVLPGMVVGFVGLPPALLDTDADHAYWPHDSQSMTAWLLVGANRFGFFLPSDVEVWEAEGVTPAHEKPPRDLEDLYLREAACHLGTDSGQVRIEEIVGPDGTTRYIVYVPATTDWSAKSGDNTTDMTTNVQGMAGNDTVMREMVRQAIADAGIDPDDEVMLVGYSQGGITAGSLAADPAFLADVNVTALMTVGSPISDFAIGSDVDVLSIEHEQDLVPDLDGNENPATDNWSTITVDYDPDELRKAPALRDKSDAEIADMLESAGAAHSSTAYAASIALLLRSGNGNLDRFTAKNSGFFTGDLRKTQDYQGKRKHT